MIIFVIVKQKKLNIAENDTSNLKIFLIKVKNGFKKIKIMANIKITHSAKSLSSHFFFKEFNHTIKNMFKYISN